MINKLKEKLNNGISIWTKTVFIVVILLLSTTIIAFNMRNKIEVVIDGQTVEITTFAKRVDQILSKNDITVTDNDKISVALDSEVESGDIIYITKAINVSLVVDGKNLSVDSAEPTVGALLDSQNIEIGKDDKVTPATSENLTPGMTVEIVRVNKELINDVQTIAFDTEKRDNSELTQGKERVVQEGSEGERTITTEVVYENGQEVSRRVVQETVSKEPVNKIIDIGTMAVITPSRPSRGDGAASSGSTSSGSNIGYAYSSVISMSSTAYTAGVGCGSTTATGTTVRRDPNGYSTVAVDPRVIPLGTRLYIEGYGLAIAEDTGGAIIGNKIDVYFGSYQEATNWGRRQVNVYILK